MSDHYDNRGIVYTDFIKNLHAVLNPRTYFEIGTMFGGTLELASCATTCVDPGFDIRCSPTGQRPATMLFQMTSDRFFQDYSPVDLFKAEIELAFLDGLHEFETTLRDFINTERHCRPNSVVMMHDCVPFGPSITTRTDPIGAWTGDVWKLIPALRKYRRDIDLSVFDASLTGLVCCTNLNPASTVLRDNYKQICAEWRDVDLSDYGFAKFIDEAQMISTGRASIPEDVRKYFWL
jgi:hypothetical protein